MKEQFPSERKCPPCLPLQVTFTSSHQKVIQGVGCHPATPALTGQTGVFLGDRKRKRQKDNCGRSWVKNFRSRVSRRGRIAQLTIKTNRRLSSINVTPLLCLDGDTPPGQSRGEMCPGVARKASCVADVPWGSACGELEGGSRGRRWHSAVTNSVHQENHFRFCVPPPPVPHFPLPHLRCGRACGAVDHSSSSGSTDSPADRSMSPVWSTCLH